jgi:hypothetical protein
VPAAFPAVQLEPSYSSEFVKKPDAPGKALL